MPRPSSILSSFLLAALLVCVPGMVWAQIGPSEKVIWRADKLVVREDGDLVTALGRVAISYKGATLKADKVVYNRPSDRAVASGNIRLIDASGNLWRAETLELTGDLREGSVKGIQALMADGNRLAANTGERIDGNITIFGAAVYTACNVCEGEEPLWQIKAREVTHNEAEKTLTYDDAVLEFAGLPIAYLPWLKHPDASVEKASGFLTPSVGLDSILGGILEVPYFWNIAPNMDATIAPIVTTDEGLILTGEFRHRVASGTYTLNSSATVAESRDDNNVKTGGSEFRGHIFGEGRFKFENGWRWGFDLAAASDDTYLRRYDFSSADTLTNRLYVERFWDRSNLSIEAYGFQGLRDEDVQDQIPIVAPFVNYRYDSKPGWLGAQYRLQASAVAFTRVDGGDAGRVSLSGDWSVPYISPFGDVYELTIGVFGDAYYSGSYEPQLDGLGQRAGQPNPQPDGFAGRIIPYAKLDWRYPFVKFSQNSKQILEPVISLVAGPTWGNDSDIPNEDSLSFEFDTTSLFALNRFNGRDLWDEGSRVSYGLRYAYYHADGWSVDTLVGQSYRFTSDTPLTTASAITKQTSDIVAAVTVRIPGWFDYYHRLQLDEDTLGIDRNEAIVVIGDEDYQLSIGYLDVSEAPFDATIASREEIRLAGRAKLSRYWSVQADFSENLKQDGGTLAVGGSLIYDDECFRFVIGARRDFTTDREVRPNTSVSARVVFKVLGN